MNGPEFSGESGSPRSTRNMGSSRRKGQAVDPFEVVTGPRDGVRPGPAPIRATEIPGAAGGLAARE
jgi:hypothetical protein